MLRVAMIEDSRASSAVEGASSAHEATRGATGTDLGDLLQEMRVLLQGAQVLSAFLIVIPFNSGFAKVDAAERWVYVATFVCAITSLILLSAPAAQHRLQRPLRDPERFKRTATRAILFGVGLLSCALVLATQLVVAEVLGSGASGVVAAVTFLVIGWNWWIAPILQRRHDERVAHVQAGDRRGEDAAMLPPRG